MTTRKLTHVERMQREELKARLENRPRITKQEILSNFPVSDDDDVTQMSQENK